MFGLIYILNDLFEYWWLSLFWKKMMNMKVVSSLKSLKKRDLNNKLVKRKGKLYVINKKNPRMKSRQG